MNRLRPALFLDRDGVINVDYGYVHTQQDFDFVGGIFELCSEARRRGYLIVVVTNQAGIARGFYTEEQFHELTIWMRSVFIERNAPIDEVYFCPFHPLEGIDKYRFDSFDRKPKPGMLLRAARELAIDLKNSIMVGDKESDMVAAAAAGIGKKVLFSAQLPALTIADKHTSELNSSVFE